MINSPEHEMIDFNHATTIAVVGKGGTGKTTVSALLVKYLIRRGRVPVLAIDGDPAVSLPHALGLPVESTVGDIREESLSGGKGVPGSMGKAGFLRLKIQEILVESNGFDLLVMGRPEGPGCYCFVNSILRDAVDALAGSYAVTLMDCEAGMEHISRRTTRRADVLVLVSDPSRRGIATAGKIAELARRLESRVGRIVPVLNRFPEGGGEELKRRLIEGMPVDPSSTGVIVLPDDPLVRACELDDRSLLEIPDDTPAYRALVKALS